MKPSLVLLLSACLIVACGTTNSDTEPNQDPTPNTGDFELVWQDEFDGAALDASKWEAMIGDGCNLGICGWGNNELQWYQAANATIEDGVLVITAREQSGGGAGYTSARLRTMNRGDWRFARVEVRAKLPIGQGLWPAIWMLPTSDVYGGWAASGEIDIMEYLGHEPRTIHGTLHYGGSWPNNTSSSNSYNLPSGTFNDDFHVFAIEWDHGEMRWYIDGERYATQTQWHTDGHAFPAPFDEEFHLLLNLAVGGNWPGNPDETTVFPQRFEIDYVRVYQRGEE